MKHKLSFCSINILSDSIAEVIINKNTVVSMEMVEELYQLISKLFVKNFGVLINKINPYIYSFEAKLSIGSHANLIAIAIVNYNSKGMAVTQDITQFRKMDDWNLKSFSGLELGWQEGLDWLKKELSAIN